MIRISNQIVLDNHRPSSAEALTHHFYPEQLKAMLVKQYKFRFNENMIQLI